MRKLASLLIITLLLFCGSSVFAAENGDTTTTTVTYTVPESYVWSAPTDITFDAEEQMQTSTLVVSKNIIAYNSFLVISIPQQDFVLTSEEGAIRNYKIYLGEDELTAGNEVLRLPAGTTEGSVDLNFKVPQVEGIKAGTYTGTLNFTAKVTGDYGITYYLNGGTNNASNPAGYKMNEGDVTILEPTKLGYTFAGWYDNAEFNGSPITKIVNGTSGNINLYAKWSASSYTINYNLDGGTNNPSNPSTYTADMLPLTLEAPTKDGYTFLGWHDGTGYVTEIPAGKTDVVSLTAKWEKALAKGDIVTLADLGFTNVDANSDTTTDTFRVLSVDGTQVKLLAMDVYKSAYFGSNNTYSGSTLDTEMTNYYNSLPADVQNAIVAQNIDQVTYIKSGSSSGNGVLHINVINEGKFCYINTATTNVGSRNVFALDIQDIADYLGSDTTGTQLKEMFFNTTGAISRTVWLRSAFDGNSVWAFSVGGGVYGVPGHCIVDDGEIIADPKNDVRPAFVIDLG